MTIEEALGEACEVCTECKSVNDCVEAECRWHHIIKALEIADRLEQADAVDVHNRFCNKFHKECYFKDGCKETSYKCEEAGAWENGYNQALVDIRGEKQ